MIRIVAADSASRSKIANSHTSLKQVHSSNQYRLVSYDASRFISYIMCPVYIISHIIYHNCSTSFLRAHFIHHASNDIVRYSCPTSYIKFFHFIYLSYHASYIIYHFRFVNHMLNCTSLVISYVIAFLMSSIIYYQINIILYGSFHTSCITFQIQSYTKYRFISYICHFT